MYDQSKFDTFVEKGVVLHNYAHIFELLSRLRQATNHPYLVIHRRTAEEDAAVVRLVARFGPKGWSSIASFIEGRVGKQCRERWQNHLDPTVSKAPWGAVEEAELLRLHKVIGNKWVEIANRMPGRTDSSVKNQFHKLTYHRPELAGLPKGVPTPAEGPRCTRRWPGGRQRQQ